MGNDIALDNNAISNTVQANTKGPDKSEQKKEDFSIHAITIMNLTKTDKQRFVCEGNLCKKHKKAFKFLCEKCKQLLCSECEIDHNNSHNIINIKRVGMLLKSKIVMKDKDEESEKIVKDIIRKIKAIMTELEREVLILVNEIKEVYLCRSNKKSKDGSEKKIEDLKKNKKYFELCLYCLEVQESKGVSGKIKEEEKGNINKILRERTAKIGELFSKKLSYVGKNMKDLKQSKGS